MFCSPSPIVEMDVERDRRACIALDHHTDHANRELAQWLLDHPLYTGVTVAEWLGCGRRRIQRLRQWAKEGFEGLPQSRWKRKTSAQSFHILKPQENLPEGQPKMSYLPPHEDVLRAAENMKLASEKPAENNGNPVKLSAFKAKKRQARLDQTLLHIRESCETTRDMPIPDDLSSAAVNEAVATLSASIELIGRLMRRLLKDEGEDL